MAFHGVPPRCSCTLTLTKLEFSSTTLSKRGLVLKAKLWKTDLVVGYEPARHKSEKLPGERTSTGATVWALPNAASLMFDRDDLRLVIQVSEPGLLGSKSIGEVKIPLPLFSDIPAGESVEASDVPVKGSSGGAVVGHLNIVAAISAPQVINSRFEIPFEPGATALDHRGNEAFKFIASEVGAHAVSDTTIRRFLKSYDVYACQGEKEKVQGSISQPVACRLMLSLDNKTWVYKVLSPTLQPLLTFSAENSDRPVVVFEAPLRFSQQHSVGRDIYRLESISNEGQAVLLGQIATKVEHLNDGRSHFNLLEVEVSPKMDSAVILAALYGARCLLTGAERFTFGSGPVALS